MSLRDCYNRELTRRKSATAKDKTAKKRTAEERMAEDKSILQSAISERRAEIRQIFTKQPKAVLPTPPKLPMPKKAVETAPTEPPTDAPLDP